jgi:hypothetical protein
MDLEKSSTISHTWLGLRLVEKKNSRQICNNDSFNDMIIGLPACGAMHGGNSLNNSTTNEVSYAQDRNIFCS